MAIFDPKSRYPNNAEIYEVTDRRGRRVMALTVPDPLVQPRLGDHIKKEGQRLDHLANFYLNDPNGFWRIAEQNGVMLPDALAEAEIVEIPTRL